DSYGFALRPQYAQRYREYSLIYKEEEGERSDKWRSFIEQIDKSSQVRSSENKHKETSEAESSEVKEEENPHRVSNGDYSSSRSFSGSTEVEETNANRTSEGNDSSGRKSSGTKSLSDCSPRNNSAKELHHLEERKTRKVQRWAEIRPSLSVIEEILSSRVKKGKKMKVEMINGRDDHL
ncbi:ecotropic viral integration site 5-like protein, partial [Trifolium medium]|nr:ecotropic viral integration site 5-like protein [Trifolium medium]